MAFSRIQTKAFVNVTSSPATNAYTSQPTKGNLLLAFVTVFSGTASIPTDTLGNIWVQAGSSFSNGGNNYLFYAINKATGANTVSVAFTGTRCYLSPAEYSGQAVSGVVLDGTVLPTKISNTQSPSCNLYVGNAGELLVEYFVASTQNETYSALTGGFALQSNVGLAGWADNLSGSVGLNTGGATASISDTISGKMWAFLPAGLTPPIGLNFVRTTEDSAKDVGAPPVSPATTLFPGGNAAGNSIILAVVQYFGTSNKVTNVTDTAGNLYSLLASRSINNAANNGWCAIYGANGSIGINTQNTISVAFAGLADACETFAAEFAGQYTFDTSTGSIVGSGQAVSYSITCATANELIYAVHSQIGATGIGGLGTQINLSDYFISSANTESVVCFLLPSSSGANALTATFTGAASGTGSIALAMIPTPVSPIVTVYSVPDCRTAPFGPNASRTVQGTKIYDVQTSDNSAIPPTDSRVSKPVDSRATTSIPQNSRAPGTFGPNE